MNTTKPPPPVRRSSSVTPSPQVGSSPLNLSQQSLMMNAVSAESLPPPPAYLLDSTHPNGNNLSANLFCSLLTEFRSSGECGRYG